MHYISIGVEKKWKYPQIKAAVGVKFAFR